MLIEIYIFYNMSLIISSTKKNPYRPNVIKRIPTKKPKKKNEKESSISLDNIELELQNNTPKEIKRSNKSNNKKKIDEEKNDQKKKMKKKKRKNKKIRMKIKKIKIIMEKQKRKKYLKV